MVIVDCRINPTGKSLSPNTFKCIIASRIPKQRLTLEHCAYC